MKKLIEAYPFFADPIELKPSLAFLECLLFPRHSLLLPK